MQILPPPPHTMKSCEPMLLCTRSIFLVLLFTMPVTHGEMFTAEQEEDVVNYVESVRKCHGIVGLTIAAVKGNDTWTRGFGKADRERGRDVSTSDLFCIGSLTKHFTSTLLSVLLNDSARYFWDTPVVDILCGDFRFVNDQLTREATLQDLLTHRTGLDLQTLPFLAGSTMTKAELAERIRYLPTKLPFRYAFNYNNWPYGLLGHVTEVMGKASWEDLLQARLLEPLGMSSTGIMGKTATVLDDNFAKPYVLLRGEILQTTSAIYSIQPFEAAGGVVSSADDMAKWLLLYVNKGWSQTGGQVLDYPHMREMMCAHVDLNVAWNNVLGLSNPPYPVKSSVTGYGYGWMTGSYRGCPMVLHLGRYFAYISFLALLPQQNLGVFVSSNGPPNDDRINMLFFYYITDILLGLEPWLNISSACQFRASGESASSTKPASNDPVYDQPDFQGPEQYAGCYSHPLYGDVHVMRSGSQGLTAQYGRLEGPLFRGPEDNVAMWEILGDMEFFFLNGNMTQYMQLKFSNSSQEELFQNVKLSFTSEELEFKR